MNNRIEISPQQIEHMVDVRYSKYPSEKINKLHSNLALPSHVHGYSLAIEFMRDWILSKFEKDYFKTVYIEGRHVLQDYKKFSKYIVKGENPRIRIEPRIEFDYDRENLDTYMAPPQIYLRKSKLNESFFKDYDRDMFIGLQMKALRMTFNIKIRVNTRSQQLDLYNRMLLYMRVGSTMQEHISVDFNIPKVIMVDIAKRSGFDLKDNGDPKDIISFLNYLNSHSDLPFLFKIRAINQHPEFFIRINDLYTHINCIDKPQCDDGERDGKLDFNFHIEQQIVLTIPIPQFYAYYSMNDMRMDIATIEKDENTIAIYTINMFDIPNTDEHGWARAAITDYSTDNGDTEMDLSPIFTGDNVLARTINHDISIGLSPSHFIDIKVYYNDDIAKECPITMDWENKIAHFNSPQSEGILHIAVYYDREYINNLDIEISKLNNSRISNAVK